MDIEGIGIELRRNHREFIHFIGTLAQQDFEKKRGEKWTVGQQLDHIIKSLAPLAVILPKKDFIQERFGKRGRPSVPYDTLVRDYQRVLLEGGKATGAFIPIETQWTEKDVALKVLEELVGQIVGSLQHYTETELDDLCLPHPLMGMLTVREMLYFTQYHVLHHLENIKQNQKN
ncbi:DinB family protein [Sinomicrobium oceani]|uniref:DinB family protein n=1 Tax=Sinomicrobium oceani TaxID=1150368 RepID=UPI00227C97B2|nr:DinB family protein [Sinomicrobium oceani]